MSKEVCPGRVNYKGRGSCQGVVGVGLDTRTDQGRVVSPEASRQWRSLLRGVRSVRGCVVRQHKGSIVN